VSTGAAVPARSSVPAGGLPDLRALLRATQETRTYLPSGAAVGAGNGAWAGAERRAGLG
jgi:hypothetical protein